jgi:thiol-disulfide isomerase/thioredoxin
VQFLRQFIATIAIFIFLSTSASAFTDLKGKKVEIEKQLGDGKWSIVELWGSDCQACRQHMPSMVEFDGKLKDKLKNARIVGITLDGQEGIANAKSFIKDFDIKFKTIVSNPIEVNAWMQEVVGEGLIGTPTFILFDPKGKVVAAQPGMVPIASLETFIKENSKQVASK